MKILFLILASEGGPDNCFTELQKQWLKYMHSNPNIESYFYKAAKTSNGEPYELSGNTLIINQDENYESIFDKTVKAFEFFEPRFSEFDWICRPNLSSFFHLDKYLDYISSIPSNFKAEGITVRSYGIEYPSGAGYSIKPEIASLIIKNNQQQYVMDDVTVGMILYRNNIDFHKRSILHAIDTNNIDEYLEKIHKTDIFHYRFKGQSRLTDLENISRFIQEVYRV